MAIFGVRKFIKSKVKDALGIDAPKSTSSNVSVTQEVVHQQAGAPKAEEPVQEAKVTTEPAKPEPVAAKPVAAEPIASEPKTEQPKESGDEQASSETKTALSPEPADDVVGAPLTMEMVQEVLDDMVRPALQGDGGDISLIKIEDSNIYVKLVGACSTCPSSVMTMKMGVEALLKEEFPSMNELIDITAEADA